MKQIGILTNLFITKRDNLAITDVKIEMKICIEIIQQQDFSNLSAEYDFKLYNFAIVYHATKDLTV